jgi:hypothetical protein
VSGSSPVELDIERCRCEIAAIEALIGAGHPDLQGLCLALSDWCAESRLIEREIGLRMERARQVEAGRAEGADDYATC